jgi:hypothetical protein
MLVGCFVGEHLLLLRDFGPYVKKIKNVYFFTVVKVW